MQHNAQREAYDHNRSETEEEGEDDGRGSYETGEEIFGDCGHGKHLSIFRVDDAKI